MVFFITKMTSLFGIATITGLMWLQDHTKKVIAIKNTAQEMLKHKPTDLSAQTTPAPVEHKKETKTLAKTT